MLGLNLTGLTGFDFGSGNELNTASVMTANMHMSDCGFRYVNLIWLHHAHDVACGTALFL
jgi:hypothetical protein